MRFWACRTLKVILASFFVATITIRERTSRNKQEALLVVVHDFKRATIFVESLKSFAKIQITSIIKKSNRAYKILNTSNCDEHSQWRRLNLTSWQVNLDKIVDVFKFESLFTTNIEYWDAIVVVSSRKSTSSMLRFFLKLLKKNNLRRAIFLICLSTNRSKNDYCVVASLRSSNSRAKRSSS